MTRRFAPLALLLGSMAIVAWVRMLPAQLPGLPARPPVANRSAAPRASDARAVERWRDDYRFVAPDGAEYTYLGGFDPYAWVIAARELIATGSVCDEVVNGECRDLSGLAPIGRTVRYPHSLHVWSIATLHRALIRVWPSRPLTATAFLVPVIVGVIAVVPAFALGYRLAGWLGGTITALLSGLNPFLLVRTIGGDNDIWSVFFPLVLGWLVVEAIVRPRQPGVGIGCAALAGVVVGPYAATWNGWPFAWVMAFAGLLANATLLLAARVLRRDDTTASDVVQSSFLVVAFVAAAGVATSLVGASPSYLDALPAILDSPLFSAPAVADVAPALVWPNAFAGVSELRAATLADVAAWMGGSASLFIGCIGLGLMLMPRRDWSTLHFAVFLGTVLLYRLVFAVPDLSRAPTILLLATPLAAALVLYVIDPRDGAHRRASIAMLVWFLAALFLGLGAVRYLVLLVPPFAVAVAVAADRFCDIIARETRSASPGWRIAASAAATGLVLTALYVPLQAGWAAAHNYMPRFNDAWYGTLGDIRAGAADDAIVTTWWPSGYAASYVSERRVSGDGGSLHTRVPYWTSRALMTARERQSAGLLRMIHCGAAVATGVSGFGPRFEPLAAVEPRPYRVLHEIGRLAELDRRAAVAELSELGLDAAAVERVLAGTHCAAPESYLVLSSADAWDRSWQDSAVWDFPSAFAGTEIARRGAGAIAVELQSVYGLDETAARATVDRVEDARSRQPRRDATVPLSRWADCTGDGPAFECAVRGGSLGGVAIRLDDPAASRLHAAADWGEPGAVLVAGPGGIEDRLGAATPARWGVLLDLETRRAVVGPPQLLRSTYAQLMLLGGRYSRLFEKVSEHTAAGERVTAWRVRWDELDGDPS